MQDDFDIGEMSRESLGKSGLSLDSASDLKCFVTFYRCFRGGPWSWDVTFWCVRIVVRYACWL